MVAEYMVRFMEADSERMPGCCQNDDFPSMAFTDRFSRWAEQKA